MDYILLFKKGCLEMSVRAKWYRFKECKVVNTTGTEITIPAGLYGVGELDIVSILLNDHRVIDIHKPAFALLKMEGKATLEDQ